MGSKKHTIKKIVLSSIFIPFILLFVFVVGGAFISKYYENESKSSDLEKLKQEIEALERSNNDMDKLLEYFNSSFFVEKEAREKLGLKRDGEKVVVIDNNSNMGNDKGEVTINNLIIDENNLPCFGFCQSPIRNWVDYFFGNI